MIYNYYNSLYSCRCSLGELSASNTGSSSITLMAICMCSQESSKHLQYLQWNARSTSGSLVCDVIFLYLSIRSLMSSSHEDSAWCLSYPEILRAQEFNGILTCRLWEQTAYYQQQWQRTGQCGQLQCIHCIHHQFWVSPCSKQLELEVPSCSFRYWCTSMYHVGVSLICGSPAPLRIIVSQSSESRLRPCLTDL